MSKLFLTGILVCLCACNCTTDKPAPDTGDGGQTVPPVEVVDKDVVAYVTTANGSKLFEKTTFDFGRPGSMSPYQVTYEAVDVTKVANEARIVPADYINERGNFVTEKFIEYVKPLVEGEIYPEYENGVPKFLILEK